MTVKRTNTQIQIHRQDSQHGKSILRSTKQTSICTSVGYVEYFVDTLIISIFQITQNIVQTNGKPL